MQKLIFYIFFFFWNKNVMRFLYPSFLGVARYARQSGPLSSKTLCWYPEILQVILKVNNMWQVHIQSNTISQQLKLSRTLIVFYPRYSQNSLKVSTLTWVFPKLALWYCFNMFVCFPFWQNKAFSLYLAIRREVTVIRKDTDVAMILQ